MSEHGNKAQSAPRTAEQIAADVPAELRGAVWHALGELLHHKTSSTVTAQDDDSGGHGGTEPPVLNPGG